MPSGRRSLRSLGWNVRSSSFHAISASNRTSTSSFLIAHEDPERLRDVRVDVDARRRELLGRDLELAHAVHRERRDPLVVAEAREQVQRRSMPHQAQRARLVRAIRALPGRTVGELADPPPRDRVDELVDQIVLRLVVDVPARVRHEHARQRIEPAVVPWAQEAADLGHHRPQVLVQRRPGHAADRGLRGVDREELGRPERDRLERADLVIDPVRLLLLADALLDDGEVALERREVALDRRLAGAELLGELLDAVRLGRVGEQPQQRPLPDQLLRIRPPLRCLRARSAYKNRADRTDISGLTCSSLAQLLGHGNDRAEPALAYPVRILSPSEGPEDYLGAGATSH